MTIFKPNAILHHSSVQKSEVSIQPDGESREKSSEKIIEVANAALAHPFIQRSKTSPELYGPEGKEISQRITKVTDSILSNGHIQRIIQDLEKEHEKRHQELQSYLDSLRAEVKSTLQAEFTESVIDIALQVWEKLRSYFISNGLCLEVPDACPGQRDNLMYTWSKGEHYFECEMFGSGEVEFFYRNRIDSSKVWGEDTTLEQEFSTTIFDKAALFAW